MVSPGRRIPQQHNCSDCGVFCSQFLKYLANDVVFDFAQQDIQHIRMKMCLEILNKKLFDWEYTITAIQNAVEEEEEENQRRRKTYIYKTTTTILNQYLTLFFSFTSSRDFKGERWIKR